MRIALIGMAGSGKTYWSKKLQSIGFTRFCCDDMIAERLAPEIKEAGFDEGSVAEWMGFPYEPLYPVREKRYLECERKVMEEILDQTLSDRLPSDSHLVIDTTGSVIYVGDDILRPLRQHVKFVLLSTPPEVQEKLLRAYISKPHPMVWHGLYNQRPSESPQQALARCYPALFESRKVLYEKYADFSIGYYERVGKDFGVQDLLNKIKQHH